MSQAEAETARVALERRLAVVERELERLTAAVTAGGNVPTLVDAMRTREAERTKLRQELSVHERATQVARLDTRRVERELRAKLDEWTALLRRQTPQARQVLKKLLDGPILFTPVQVGNDSYCEFKATIGLSQMLSGTVLATMVASPQGIAELCTVEI
jgi:hypothetical protein